jgi:hypothetical protein
VQRAAREFFEELAEEPVCVSHSARDYVAEVLAFKREKALLPLHRVVARLRGGSPLPGKPVRVVQVMDRGLKKIDAMEKHFQF